MWTDRTYRFGNSLGFLCAGMLLLAATIVTAADEPPAQKEPTGESQGKSSQPATLKDKKSLLIDELEGPVEIIRPGKSRTPDEQSRLDAVTWYMSGQVKEARNEFTEAYADYEKAVKLDPKSVPIYKALVPLAFSLNKTKEAMDYAIKAIELDPKDYQLLRRVGAQLAAQRKLDEAASYLEKAAAAASLDKKSVAFVSLNRDLAVLFLELRQPEKAAAAYEIVFDAIQNPEKYSLDFQMLARLKNDPATQFERMGEAFFEGNKPELAVRAYEKALEAAKGKPGQLSVNLAKAYVRTKKYDDALSQLQKYFNAQLQTQGREPYELLAEILKETNQPGELIARLEEIAKSDARNSSLQYYLADQYVAADRLKEAEEIFTKVLKDSADPEGYVGLAVIYRRQGRAEELLDTLAKALRGKKGLERLETEVEEISKDAKLVDAMVEVGRKISSGEEPKLNFFGSFILAKLASRTKKTDAAIEFYRYALKTRRNQAAMIFMELGRYLFLEKEYAKAADVFKEAAADPVLEAGKADFLLWTSRSQEMAGDTNAAIATLQEALKIQPNHPELLFVEAWIYTHSRQWDEAIKKYEQIIARFPQDADLQRRCLFSLSNVHVQKGDMRAGEKILEDVLAKDSEDPSVNNDLGYLYADQGKNLEQAEKMIRKAIAAEPENPAYLDSMGWVLYRLGKYAEALPHLEKAIANPSGSDATIYDHLGDCYEKLNQPEKAREAWEKALQDAKGDSRPDEKLVEKIEEKLKKK